jgi:GNAT superfamily N-acetyltransferase
VAPPPRRPAGAREQEEGEGLELSARHDRAEPPVGDERLRDGTLVRVRPVRPDDKGRLAEGFLRLSSRSRYHRFFGAVSSLSDALLRYLTELDQVDHIAWIAVDPATAGEPALGVARCVRAAGEPDVAEVAVVVGDPYQDRGLGSLLLERLAGSAAAQGVRTFRAFVLRENEAVVHALQELGIRSEVDEGVLHVDVPVEQVREIARAARLGPGV